MTDFNLLKRQHMVIFQVQKMDISLIVGVKNIKLIFTSKFSAIPTIMSRDWKAEIVLSTF